MPKQNLPDIDEFCKTLAHSIYLNNPDMKIDVSGPEEEYDWDFLDESTIQEILKKAMLMCYAQ